MFTSNKTSDSITSLTWISTSSFQLYQENLPGFLFLFKDTYDILSNTEEEGDTSDCVPKIVINVHIRADPRRQLASHITSGEPVWHGTRRELFARLAYMN